MGTEYQNGDSLYVVAVKILKKLSGSLGGGGGGDFVQAQYVTTQAHAGLDVERVLTGTANRVSVTDGGPGGPVILSLPQDHHTAAHIQFDRLGLGVAPGGAGTLTAVDDVKAGADAELGWTGRAAFISTDARRVAVIKPGGNDFQLFQIGGTGSSYPALEPNNGGIIVKRADDSGYSFIRATPVYTEALVIGLNDDIIFSRDTGGALTLINGTLNLFQLGGVTNGFPALKRSGADLHVRLADDSAFTDLHLAEIFASGGQIDTLLTDVLSVNTSISLLTGATILSDNGTLSDNGAGFTIAGDTIFSAIVTAQGGILSHGNVTPNAGNSHDLGTSTTFKWRDLYLGRNGIGATATDSLYLTNETDAAAGAQQYSPALRFRGQGWKTDATAASRPTDLRIYALPIQGAANPTVRLMFDASVNGAAFANLMHLENNGTLTVAGTVVSSTHIVAGAAASLSMFLRAKFTSPADSVMTISNNAVTDFNRLQFGGTTSSFPALKRVSAELQVRLADDSADGDLKSRQITTSSTDFIHETSAALADGAGAQAGTITNAPSAGNPTKWIAINDNGTTRYIPTWT